MRNDDLCEGLTRSRQQENDSHWFIKLLALVILLLCVAIGMVGIILPIIPGLLFLALAALITARMFPALAARLRRNRFFAVWLDSTEGFTRLSLRNKFRYIGWLMLRMLMDGIIMLHKLVTQLLIFVSKNPTRV